MRKSRSLQPSGILAICGWLGVLLVSGCVKPKAKPTPVQQDLGAPVVSKSKRVDSKLLLDPVLRALCGIDNLQVLKKEGEPASAEEVVCSICPKLDLDFGPPGEAHVLSYVQGSFTSSHRTEALVSLSGCEAHYLNYGGSFLLEDISKSTKQNSKTPKWVKKAYYEGWVPSRCETIGSSLICETHFSNMDGQQSILEQVRVIDEKQKKSTTLVHYGSNLNAGLFPTQHIYNIENTSWGIESTGSGRSTMLELHAHFKIQEGSIPQDLSKEVIDHTEKYLGPTEELKLSWMLHGPVQSRSLKANSFTRAATQRFEKVTQENVK